MWASVRRRLVLLAACAGLALAPLGLSHAQQPPVRVVYHFGEGQAQASRGLEFMRNHLEVDPQAQIVAVAHAAGVDFLMKGAKTAKGNEFLQAIEDLQLAGAKFRVCEITLRERGLRRDQFVADVEFVASGVAEIARLQGREGYGYIRP